MSSSESLPERIRRKSDQLSVSQRKVARYCVTDPESAGTLTALRIAEQLQVSESTVVRFAVKMGYRGFPDMQSAIRSAAERLAESDSRKGRTAVDGRVGESLAGDLRSLEETIATLRPEQLLRAADVIAEAASVHVCGFRSSFSLAHLAEYLIRQVRRSVRLIDAIGGTQVDDLELIEPDDAVLVFTFPVYDDRAIATIEYAARLGAQCVVVTDSALAPLPLGDNVQALNVRHEGPSFYNSNVAATALLNALVIRLIELTKAKKPNFERQLLRSFQRERMR